MPVIKSAKKKLKIDKKRTSQNKEIKDFLNKAVKRAKTNSSAKNLTMAFKAIDKAAKKNVIHKNKAARVKSRLSKITVKKHPQNLQKGLKNN